MDEWKKPIDSGKIPESEAHFDVIVVGGGPGGSAAAAYNALNGCKVVKFFLLRKKYGQEIKSVVTQLVENLFPMSKN